MKILNVLKDIKKGQLPSFTYMFKRIWEQAGHYSKKYRLSRLYLFVDYFWCALIHGCSGTEYFIYEFFLLNRKGKRKLVSELYEAKFEKKHTDEKQEAVIEDKEKSLSFFGKYIDRDWCGASDNNTEERFGRFYDEHEIGIIKPLCGHGGAGVEIVKLKERFESAAALREHCLKNKLLIEELINQHDELNRVFPTAINTARIITLKGKVIGAALRMGVGESNVDNAHAGGIFAEIDINEGITIGQAMRYTGERFLCHPTTGTIIPGFEIPFWSECKAMVEEASKLVPDVYLIGWDVAVTPDGPTLVEVNTHPGLTAVQAPNGHGLKHEFERIKD